MKKLLLLSLLSVMAIGCSPESSTSTSKKTEVVTSNNFTVNVVSEKQRTTTDNIWSDWDTTVTTKSFTWDNSKNEFTFNYTDGTNEVHNDFVKVGNVFTWDFAESGVHYKYIINFDDYNNVIANMYQDGYISKEAIFIVQ